MLGLRSPELCCFSPAISCNPGAFLGRAAPRGCGRARAGGGRFHHRERSLQCPGEKRSRHRGTRSTALQRWCVHARVPPAPLWVGIRGKTAGSLAGALSSSASALCSELSDQIQRALTLEEERKRAQAESERLEAERLAALHAKDELERQAADQIKSQEQLVGGAASWCSVTGRLPRALKEGHLPYNNWYRGCKVTCLRVWGGPWGGALRWLALGRRADTTGRGRGAMYQNT